MASNRMWNAFIMRSGFYCCTHNKYTTLAVGARTIWSDLIESVCSFLVFSSMLFAKPTNRFQTIITDTLFVYFIVHRFHSKLNVINGNHLISSSFVNCYYSFRMTNRKVPQYSISKTKSNNNNNKETAIYVVAWNLRLWNMLCTKCWDKYTNCMQ